MKRLKARIAAKLKGNGGESLAEVLISLLIAALAMTMLAYAISSTSRIITKSKEKMEKYYQANDVVTEQTSGGTGPVEFSLTAAGGDSGETPPSVNLMDTQQVMLFTNDEAGDKNRVVSYKYKQQG